LATVSDPEKSMSLTEAIDTASHRSLGDAASTISRISSVNRLAFA